MIGLFLGDTDFSEIVLKKIKKQNIKYFVIDFSAKNKFKREKNSFRVSIGKFGAIINLIKEKKYKNKFWILLLFNYFHNILNYNFKIALFLSRFDCI
mgnify:CR=1 FL=1